MERKYSLNEVDDFISKYKNKKNLNINNNSQKNNKDISNKKLYFINNKNKENSYKNNLINISTKEESKNNFEDFINDKNKTKECLSVFNNIYNSFSNNLSINNKENVFDSNILDSYFEELDINYEETKERRNKIILQKEIKEKKDGKKIILNKNIKIKRQPKYNNYFSFDKNYLIKYSDKDNIISLEHCYSLLFNDVNYFLYNNYTPVSYENNNLNIKKYQDLISILIDKDYIKEPIGYIALLLIQNILSKDIDLNKINLFQDIEIKNKILNKLLNSFKNKSNPQSKFSSFVNSKKVLDILNTQKYNYINYNLLSNQENNNPIDFVLNLFSTDIFNKRNSISYFYFILLNLNEINIKENSKEIFNNFEICLYIIFNYLSKEENKTKKICEILLNEYYQNMTYCQYIILKIILGNHEIIEEKYYAKLFTSFLNFPSMEKLLIADCYNLILYSINSKVENIFAKCSILIKYKYSLLKTKFKQDKNDIILKEKIYENIAQFGKIHKNKFFMNYIESEFCLNKNNEEINKKDENEIANEENKENILNEDNKEIEINEKENKEYGINNIEEYSENKESSNNGFFSSIKFAFGFGTDSSKNN